MKLTILKNVEQLTNVIFRIHVHGHIFHFVKKWTIHAHES